MKILFQATGPYSDNSPFNHLKKDIYLELNRAGIEVHRVIPIHKGGEPKDVLPLDKEPSTMTYDVLTVTKAPKSNFFLRYLNSLLSTFRLFRKGLKVKDIDVVLSIVPQTAFVALILAKLKRKKMVALLMDIWPNNAIEAGVLKEKSIVYKIFLATQKKVYKHVDAIITISEDMKNTMVESGAAAEKIYVAYNWSHVDEPIVINKDENKFAEKYNLVDDVFRIIYAGNIGAMQNVEMIVNAAEILKDRDDIKFLIIGSGVNEKKIKEKVGSKDLLNVSFFPFQPSEMAEHIYALANINMIPLRQGAVYTALPSKTAICLSCGRPIIACVDKKSNYATMLQENGAAMVVEPDDAKGLAEAIKIIKDNADLQTKMGASAITCFETYFRKEENVKVYSDVFKYVLKNDGEA